MNETSWNHQFTNSRTSSCLHTIGFVHHDVGHQSSGALLHLHHRHLCMAMVRNLAPLCWRLLKNHWIQLVKMFIDVHPPKVHNINQYHIYIYINIIYLDRPQLRTKQLSAPSQIGSLPYSGDFFSSPVLGLATAQCSIAMVTITKTTFFNGNEPIKSEQYSITHGYKMIHILIESCWFIYIDNISEATFTSQNLTGW